MTYYTLQYINDCGDTVAREIFTAPFNFEVDAVIDAVANVAVVAAPAHETLIRAIEETLNDALCGIVKEPDFDRLGAEMVDCLTVLIKGYGDIVESKNVR